MRLKILLAAAAAVTSLACATNAPAKNITECISYGRLGATTELGAVLKGSYGCGPSSGPTSATPEPSTWALMGLGAALVGGVLYTQRRRQTPGATSL